MNRTTKLSKYNVLVDHSGKHILYNQVTNALILLAPDEIDLWRKLENGELNEQSNFSKMLVYGGYLIPFERDEIAFLDDLSRKNKNFSSSKSFTLAPTDRCNLDCVYCYEAKDQWVIMSDEVQAQVEKFFDAFIASSPTTSFSTTWFGGEPTLHIKAIERLSNYFKTQLDSKGIQFNQMMITNGTTLNKGMRDRLKKIGVMGLQITIDGDKDNHDAQRPYRLSLNVIAEKTVNKSCGSCGDTDIHSKSSFDKIFENLVELRKEGFRVGIRVNITSKNVNGFDSVTKKLQELGLDQPHESGGYIVTQAARVNDSDIEMSKADFADRFPDITLKAFTGTNCMADTVSSFGISQNGTLSKCWHHITDEVHSVGTVYDMHLAKGYVDKYSPADDPECSTCSVLASCWGGCKAFNKVWDNPNAVKNDGCNVARWNMSSQVIQMYEAAIVSEPTDQL